ncbi:MAG: hypothetical protein KDC38_14105, partial [Planctomycetes bacterium]|nr:hypothetical protein [Planctomycetota bacterium]
MLNLLVALSLAMPQLRPLFSDVARGDVSGSAPIIAEFPSRQLNGSLLEALEALPESEGLVRAARWIEAGQYWRASETLRSEQQRLATATSPVRRSNAPWVWLLSARSTRLAATPENATTAFRTAAELLELAAPHLESPWIGLERLALALDRSDLGGTDPAGRSVALDDALRCYQGLPDSVQRSEDASRLALRLFTSRGWRGRAAECARLMITARAPLVRAYGQVATARTAP